jgi:hypothetical protein
VAAVLIRRQCAERETDETEQNRSDELHAGLPTTELVERGDYNGDGRWNLIEATDLQEAIEIAAGFLGEDRMASIEVRPVVSYQIPDAG